MAAAQCFVYKNDGTNTNTYLTSTAYPTMPSASALGWSRDGYTFVNWNSESDGSGTSIEVGDVNPADYEVYYAIWEEDAPSYDVTISYKSNVIATMSASGTKTLETSGKYCEDDITVEYTKPSGGGTPTLQSKTVSPSTSQQTVTPDSGYDGLSSVTVYAMPSGSATTPATTITANPTITVSASGLITASVSKTQGVTPTVSAGYVASGTSGTITVNGSNTNQLTAKSAQTYTPTTTDQTIASGQYLTGVQIIKGDANLLAENIKKDVVIFGITGTYEGDVPSGYTVTVSLTNPINASGFSRCEIVELLSSDPNDTGAPLATISSPTGSTTIDVPNSIYGIGVQFTGWSPNSGTSSCTGNITQVFDEYGYVGFSVGSDGTITIDGVNYDD